jgi:hypothetical protein
MLRAVSLLLVGVWCAWWAVSLYQGDLVGCRCSWFGGAPALACFVPRAANDYSLVFLPMAALAVWDRHDPLFVHVGLAALLLWWQPFALPIDGGVLLVIKVAGLAVAGVSLAERAAAPIPRPAVQPEDAELGAPMRMAA